MDWSWTIFVAQFRTFNSWIEYKVNLLDLCCRIIIKPTAIYFLILPYPDIMVSLCVCLQCNGMYELVSQTGQSQRYYLYGLDANVLMILMIFPWLAQSWLVMRLHCNGQLHSLLVKRKHRKEIGILQVRLISLYIHFLTIGLICLPGWSSLTVYPAGWSDLRSLLGYWSNKYLSCWIIKFFMHQ